MSLDDIIGHKLGKYELRERIGRGGMAEVYKGYHPNLDRFVAIKLLHPFLGEDPEFKQRFEREARNIAQLRHPNIVQVYDFEVETGRDLYYMVMEFIDGPTLRTRLMQLGFQGENFTISEAVKITRDLASALAYAHSRGMVHRDIKPANIMMDSDGRVVLTDFGIARIVSGPNMTASGSMVGTPAYMSPEQGLGQSGDNRSDIYSLGVVLYQLVTGTTPYDADTPIAIVLKHVNDPLPPPSNINPDLPDSLERIIFKALAKSPDERYQRIEDMMAHLENMDAITTLVLPAVKPEQAKSAAAALESAGAAPIAKAETPAAPEAVPSAGSRVPNFFLALLVMLLAFGGGGYLSYTGLLDPAINQYVPALVPVISAPTPTPQLPSSDEQPQVNEQNDEQVLNLQSTQQALDEAVSELATRLETPGATALPDPTATFLACDFDYELVDQSPENGLPYLELRTMTLEVTIINDSQCALDDDTRLVFEEGFQLDGPDFVEFNQRLEPGDEYTIRLNLRMPRYNQNSPTIRSTWHIIQPDGTQVGEPLTFEYTLYHE